MVGNAIFNVDTKLLCTTNISSLYDVCIYDFKATMHCFTSFSDVSLAHDNFHLEDNTPSCCLDIEVEKPSFNGQGAGIEIFHRSGQMFFGCCDL